MLFCWVAQASRALRAQACTKVNGLGAAVVDFDVGKAKPGKRREFALVFGDRAGSEWGPALTSCGGPDPVCLVILTRAPACPYLPS